MNPMYWNELEWIKSYGVRWLELEPVGDKARALGHTSTQYTSIPFQISIDLNLMTLHAGPCRDARRSRTRFQIIPVKSDWINFIF